MNVPAINLGAKPRVVFISTMHGNGWGGSEELWGRTAERLIKGNRAQVLAHLSYFPEPVRQREELRAIGCAIETGHPDRLRHLVSRRVVTALGMGRKPYLVRARPDLVVISQGAHFDGAAWMIECADRKIPYAAVSHCFVEGHPFADTHTDPLRRGYEESLRSYFVSEANLRDTRRQIATPLAQGRVVRNPCNVPFTAAPEWPEPKDGVFRIATVARLDTVVKGHDILMEVLNSPKWKARPLHVSLYGKGTNENSLKRLKAMYGLDNVTFMGTTNDVEGIWRDHHALVLTSRWEGLPLAVVEAMLCGRICIVTDVGGSAELLTDNDTGFVAAAARPQLVDDALERAWQCRDEWRERGKRAAIQVRGQIPEDAIAVFADEVMSLLV